MKLGPTAYVILGILNLGPHSGYDIKQLADLSTRHFWATSYGQIYPELKRLTESGLIKSEDASKGTRQRTLYHLTTKGKQTLHSWVSDPAILSLEIRDEMLLKLFFADAMSRKETVRHLEAMKRPPPGGRERAARARADVRGAAASHAPPGLEVRDRVPRLERGLVWKAGQGPGDGEGARK